MIERIDPAPENQNATYRRFVTEHMRRYFLAAHAIDRRKFVRRPVIVDAACGCGYGHPYLSRVGEYVGLDRDVRAVQRAQSEYRGTFVVDDLERFTCLSELQPDVIVSLETAEHLPDPLAFLRRVHEALPSGGMLVFSVPTSLTMDFDPFHLHDWSAERWRFALERQGFAIDQEISMPFETSFWSFLRTVPTTWRQRGRIGRFLVEHPRYLLNRLWHWGVRGRFQWCTTLWVCAKPSY